MLVCNVHCTGKQRTDAVNSVPFVPLLSLLLMKSELVLSEIFSSGAFHIPDTGQRPGIARTQTFHPKKVEGPPRVASSARSGKSSMLREKHHVNLHGPTGFGWSHALEETSH